MFKGVKYSVYFPCLRMREAAVISWHEKKKTDRKSWHESELFWLWCDGCCLGCSLRECNYLALEDYNGQSPPPTTTQEAHMPPVKMFEWTSHISVHISIELYSACVCGKTGQEREQRSSSKDRKKQERLVCNWAWVKLGGLTKMVYVGMDLQHLVCWGHWIKIGHKVDWDEIYPSFPGVIMQHCDPVFVAIDVCVPADVNPIWDLLLLYPWEMCLV